ncbi:MAG: hypothetical protein J1E03_13280, partial [Acetatifactor sp.]|nr:hypothetical protein [Acetatifactor sp.]
MDIVKGSMETLNAMQLTANMEGLDAQSKTLLHRKEVLAVILQGVVSEYRGYSRQEIMDFIEADSIVDGKEVSPGRTNTKIQGDAAEFVQLNEKTSQFDVAFRVKNPRLSTEEILVSLHVDVESQKSYRPGYPIEKRGIYYLARSLSSQLSLVTENTDYGSLEKCYSIWICRDDIPIDDKYSISFYEVSNTKNIGGTAMEKGKYDLMTLAVIKLGDTVYNGEKGDEGFELLHFLNTIMYPHREDFIEELSDYIDFSENEELWKEKPRMFSLSQCIYEDGLKEGREQGIASLVLDHIEEHMPKEKSIQKL